VVSTRAGAGSWFATLGIELHLRLDREPAGGGLHPVIAGRGTPAVWSWRCSRPARRDADLWKAAWIDGIPTSRVYLSIVLPLLGPMIVTVVVLLSVQVARLYDLVVAMTRGGPGIASEVPA
jgi:hypothetical protein